MSATQTATRGMVEGEFLLTQRDFRTIAGLLETEAGITLSEGKATLLYSRLGKRLRALGMQDFSQYCDLVESVGNEDERERMVRALTTNVTRFYREPHHFEYLRGVLLPPLLRAAERGARVRIWSAACSTGPEPYSIALTILDLLPKAAQLNIRVLATDIDTGVLEEAATGRYNAESLEPVPRATLDRWFTRDGDEWRVSADLRQLVTFRMLNLIKPFPMKGPFDAIFCRNVVIYFNESLQQAVWSRFEPLLTPSGILFAGHSERVTGPAAASFRSCGITIYQRQARS